MDTNQNLTGDQRYYLENRERLLARSREYTKQNPKKYPKYTRLDKLKRFHLEHLIGEPKEAQDQAIQSARLIRNKELDKAKQKRTLKRVRDFVWEYKKAHPCKQCGESDPACLDFHHRDEKDKTDHMARVMKCGMKATIAEIAKCDVLCANCHRKHHHKRRTC